MSRRNHFRRSRRSLLGAVCVWLLTALAAITWLGAATGCERTISDEDFEFDDPTGPSDPVDPEPDDEIDPFEDED